MSEEFEAKRTDGLHHGLELCAQWAARAQLRVLAGEGEGEAIEAQDCLQQMVRGLTR